MLRNENESVEDWETRRAAVKKSTGNGNGFGMPLTKAVEYLPTPTVQDASNIGGESQFLRNSVPLNAEVQLDPENLGVEGDGESDDATFDLTADGDLVNWIEYRPAVKRAEAVLGRLAPSPTDPGVDGGKRRLAPRFVEFMMMLPEAWVTGHGLTRNEELARLGNGVVPVQAAVGVALGIRRLLESRHP